MQEYSRHLFTVNDPSLNTLLEKKDDISLTFHKSTIAERHETTRAKGLSFGNMGTEIINSFYLFWQNLVLRPESNKEGSKIPLTSLIIEKDGGIYENQFLHDVLAEILQVNNPRGKPTRHLEEFFFD